MNFTNINDPAGVKALLEQLRSSQAWQDVVSTPTETVPEPASAQVPANAPTQAAQFTAAESVFHDQSAFPDPQASSDASPDVPSPSVASLLSQLQFPLARSAAAPHAAASPAAPADLDASPAHSHAPASAPLPLIPAVPSARHSSVDAGAVAAGTGRSPARPSSVRREDLRSLTFQQALPHLARLSEDLAFADAISEMKKEQADLERLLWEERRAILRKQEEKVKVALTKASLVGGTGLTQYEADTMSDAFRCELSKFDAHRVLPAWDGLVAKQQAKLEGLGVPTMFPTSAITDRERQQRIVHVLVGIAGNEDS